MKVALVYPYVVPKADLYRQDFGRFLHRFHAFPPEAEHRLFLTFCNGRSMAKEDSRLLWPLIEPMAPSIIEYHGDGWDIGAHQHVANSLPSNFDFVVFCSSQVHFHRAGWLRRMVEAREKFGPGLYGGLASHENRPHLRTCFFGCDPADLRAFPWMINSKELSLEFESGKTGFWTWIRANGRKEVLVTWDKCYDDPMQWRTPENGFRRGDQTDCLVWDRHTRLYEVATPAEKATLEQLADGRA